MTKLESRHLFMCVGIFVAFLAILLGILTETYLFPILIFLMAIVVILAFALRPMFQSEKTIFLIATILVSLPLTVLIHESVHYVVGSLIWPGQITMTVNYLSGVTVASVDSAMVEATNQFYLWLFYASAPLVCVAIGCILVFWLYKSKKLAGVREYLLVFGLIILAFNLFALYPSGASDLGQANRVLIDAGAPETLSTILHFAIFFVVIVLISVLGARILWKKKVL